jgi:glycosyltransferase involved in cell wall biosynthesis
VARSDVPLVVTEHTEGPWKSPRDRSISQIAYRRANHVIAVSRAIRRQLVGDYRVPPTKVTYIPNAVRPWSGTRVRPREWGEPGPLIGRVSRLAPEKGVDVFLRAAAIVAGEVPGARFAVIGDGPQAGELRGLAAELGIGRRVRFLGHRPDARAVIASLDLLAVSSLTEGSPLVNLEAMAAGVPIAASACGGIPDQIRDEIDGLLVPPADAPALAHALLRLIREPGLTRRISDAARRRAATEFSYAAMVARVLECYEAADARQRAVAR